MRRRRMMETTAMGDYAVQTGATRRQARVRVAHKKAKILDTAAGAGSPVDNPSPSVLVTESPTPEPEAVVTKRKRRSRDNDAA